MRRRIGPSGSSIPYRPTNTSSPIAPLGQKARGMGNPFEDQFYFEGFRSMGPGEERPRDTVIDPACDPTRALSPEMKQSMEALKCTLNDVLARQVVFTKFPANVQPPWFAKPIIKAKAITIAAGETEAIFDRMIEARMRAVVTSIGIDAAPTNSILDGTCEFWFDEGSEQKIIQVFDDQTATAYEESDGLTMGKTAILPGSLNTPFNLKEAGLQFLLKGPTMLRFMCHNKGDAAVTIRGIMGYYQYWLPYGATEFENADVQM